MISTLEHAVVIYLGWIQPRKSFVLAISGLQYLNTVMRLLRNAHLVNIFYPKKRTHPNPLHPVIAIGPFSKWGIDFMHCKPTSIGGNGYIIVVVDYFMKWD